MVADVPQTGLLALVDELLLSIIDHIDTRDALCKLAASCRRFQGLAEPYIWRSLLVTNGDSARNIAAALDIREARSSYIQELSIRYPDYSKDGIQELNHFIVLMNKLRHLTIESPCPNNSEWKDGVEFDGWTKIDYATLLEASVYPRKGVPPTLPMLQSRKSHSQIPYMTPKWHYPHGQSVCCVHSGLYNLKRSLLQQTISSARLRPPIRLQLLHKGLTPEK